MMNPVKKLREENGLTQQQLADRLKINIRTVQRWEEGRTVKPKIMFFVHLALLPSNFLT